MCGQRVWAAQAHEFGVEEQNSDTQSVVQNASRRIFNTTATSALRFCDLSRK